MRQKNASKIRGREASDYVEGVGNKDDKGKGEYARAEMCEKAGDHTREGQGKDA